MADILIRNMELPKDGHYYLEVFTDGEIRRCDNVAEGFVNTDSEAVALPEHGDLADKIDIIHRIEKIADADLAQDIIGEILASPTIVEATE